MLDNTIQYTKPTIEQLGSKTSPDSTWYNTNLLVYQNYIGAVELAVAGAFVTVALDVVTPASTNSKNL
ncbi:hypothetical protein PQ689_06535 [Thermoanaerobacterium thermosaccharolyticum]|uniref:hypothetical protein n=1 Tax=Thermoanaerobacterium thermosaccharolyticum TaxID=1517 RepID=UPI002FD9CF1A